MLEEIGAPYQLRLVDREKSAHKDPEYLRLTPNGLIPAFVAIRALLDRLMARPAVARVFAKEGLAKQPF